MPKVALGSGTFVDLANVGAGAGTVSSAAVAGLPSTRTPDGNGLVIVSTAAAPTEVAVTASPLVIAGEFPGATGGGNALQAWSTALSTLVIQLPASYATPVPAIFAKVRNTSGGSLALSARVGAGGSAIFSTTVSTGQSCLLTIVPFMTADAPWVVTGSTF